MDELPRNSQDDPDYAEFHAKQTIDRSKLQEDSSKDQTIKKINKILSTQFKEELSFKVEEVNIINDRIQTVQSMLDRLRAYITASYYGSGEKLIPMSRSKESNRKRKKDSDINRDDVTVMPVNLIFNEKVEAGEILLPETLDIDDETKLDKIPELKPITDNVVNRFYVNKKIIVGNISKYLLSDSRKENDKSTHKWMVYCRGPQEEPDISHYVKSVWFFLHPSYIPNDIVQVNKPPFQITRRGWGEFPVRVQLHFKDARNKRFDIIHNLKLDKTYTGLQTLGAETVVNLELNRHAVGSDTIIPYLNDSSSSEQQGKQSTKPLRDDNLPNNKIEDFSSRNNNNILISKSNTSNTCDESLNFCGHSLSRSNSLTFSGSDRLVTPSAISSCVTSASISRCNSPTRPLNDTFNKFIFTDEIDSSLRKLIDSFPLIKSASEDEGYTCDSIERFKSWSFSKRRACEWQRAVNIRRALLDKHSPTATPSTKQILKWCRYNCYSPCENDFYVIDSISTSDEAFCQFCGIFIKRNNVEKSLLCQNCVKNLNKPFVFSSKSPMQLVYNEIENKEKTVACLKELNVTPKVEEQDVFIDVVRIPRPLKKFPTQIRYEIPKSIETDWVAETCQEIGVVMTSSNHRSIKGPFASMVLSAAVKHFMSEMLRRSNGNVVIRSEYSFSPALVTVSALWETINSTKKFDFLQEIALGKYISDDVKKKT